MTTTTTMTTTSGKPARRRPPARQRQMGKLLANMDAAPAAEQSLFSALAYLIQHDTPAAAAILPELRPEAFREDGAADVVHAVKAAAAANMLGLSAVIGSIRLAAKQDGLDPENTPGEILLTEAVKDLPRTTDSAKLTEQCRKALEEITHAFENRQKAAAALDTLHELGVTTTTTTTLTATTTHPVVAMRGEKWIRIRPTNHAEVTDDAEQLLAGEMFVRDGRLVTVSESKTGPAMVPATKERIADRLERLAAFVDIVPTPNGDAAIPTPCPGWLPPRLVNKQVWPAIRELRGIASGPYLRPDGTIGGTTAGYDASTQLLTVTKENWSTVKLNPTADDVQAAVADLLDLVKDFPFEHQGADDENTSPGGHHAARLGHSVWLAALLTLFARPAFDGPSPLFVFDATTAGSGKTLLAKLLSIIAFGHEPCLAGMKDQPAELQKTLISALFRGDPLHVFDNVRGTIGNDVLDNHLTAANVKDRRLGTNEIITAENLMMLVATSNNAAIGADTARRTLTLRLRPLADNPEEIEHDREPARHAMTNRPRYVAAALTILRWHFMHRDTPAAKVRPFGSFENWSDAVRMAVIRAGLPDPLRSQDYVRQIDDGSQLRAALINAWANWRPSFVGTARALVTAVFETRPDGAFEDDSPAADKLRGVIMDLTHCARTRPGADEARKMGYIIRGLRGRMFMGRSIEAVTRSGGGNEWRLALPANDPAAQGGDQAHDAEAWEDPF